MSTARSGILVSHANMTWDGILTTLGASVVSALASGGLVAKLLDTRTAKTLAEFQEKSKLRSEEILDRQKLTEEIHTLYLGVAHKNEILHKEQLDYERRISKLEQDGGRWEMMACEQDLEIRDLKATKSMLEGRLKECERRWSDFLKVKDR